EIIHQESLNSITSSFVSDGKEQHITTNYHAKLDKQEAENKKTRRSWSEVGNIKELKEGYLSHVVHKICKLMVDYNAIVVMEDLNFGFKKGRIHVEKQVYQKFEKALIDKLNYLVFKDRDAQEPGGVLNALQLSSKFDSFSKLGKQSGFIFYTQAAYTSKIDPTTGFLNLLNPKYTNVSAAQNLFKEFDSIRWNEKEQYFEFIFDYKKLSHTKKRECGVQTKWMICSYGRERFVYDAKMNSNKGGYEQIDVTEKLKELFKGRCVDYKAVSKEDVVKQDDKSFFSNLIFYLRLLMQMRNSATINGEVHDFILSPVKNKEGVFYDSRHYNSHDAKLPQDADANGAYNIALKGLLMIDKIKECDAGKKLNLAISNKEWFEYAQGRVE
ncbi:MAG: type V CRISPR-associated protein Cas12a/Cpf1, partial [Mangrovibacterium sp.]